MISKNVFLCFFSFILCISGKAQVVDSSAKIKLVHQFHDFGDLQEGTLAKTKFTFVSVGQVPLWISSIERSCGCTTPRWPKDPIAPGDTAHIEVWFNTENRNGHFTKTLRIISNNKGGEVPISIIGNIIKAQ